MFYPSPARDATVGLLKTSEQTDPISPVSPFEDRLMVRALAPPTRARWFVFALLAVTLVSAALARTGVPPFWVFSVHRVVSAEMAQKQIPGLSLAVATNGKVRWSTGYGLADIENQIAARPETVYRWASVSKPVTAVAVMQLVERGKIDLDAPIQTYLPTFPVKPWPVTTRQLLSHLGGVRHYKGDERDSTLRYVHFRDAFGVFETDPLVCQPGTKHVYSSYGYNLLGAVVEDASGEPFVGYLRNHVFRPAGMTHARADVVEALIPHRARGYVKTTAGELKNSRLADLSNKVPGGGLCGTAEDALRFALALQSGTLLPAASREAMWTRQKISGGRAFDYGLGWSLSRRNGRREVWHAGQTTQSSTLLYMLPDQRFAVALMANLENAPLLDLARKIADLAAP